MYEARSISSRLPEARIRVWLSLDRGNAVISEGDRMLDLVRISFWHVAAGAIVRRSIAQAHLQRQVATLFSMTAQALCSVIRGSFLWQGLKMRIMTCDTSHFSAACSVALAEGHQEMVLEQR